jgi:hypothetical protein
VAVLVTANDSRPLAGTQRWIRTESSCCLRKRLENCFQESAVARKATVYFPTRTCSDRHHVSPGALHGSDRDERRHGTS